MPAAYSMDFRKKVMQAVERGDRTQQEVADAFEIGIATVGRLRRRKRETGALAPKPQLPSPKRRAIDAHGDEHLRAMAMANPDATELELTDLMTDDGFPLSRSSVNRALTRLGLTRKKRRS